jgi:quercetin dioxygenase-like cupin family protein
MKIVRIYTGNDQQAHFEEIKLSFEGGQAILSAGSRPASEATFRCAPSGTVIDWHPAPRRQYVVTLSGQWDIECGDGSVQRFGAGDVMLADDLTGQGHIARVSGDEPHIFMTVPLSD